MDKSTVRADFTSETNFEHEMWTSCKEHKTSTKTWQSALIADGVSSRIITVSGTVTIATMSLVFFPLLAVVLLLFRSVTVRRTTAVSCSGEAPPIFSVDEYHVMTWALLSSDWFIVRAIVCEPEVLLLNEPWSLLDPIANGKIEELLSGLRNDCSVLIVARNMQHASQISDATALMYVGCRLEYGLTIDRLTRTKLPEIEDCFKGKFG